MNNIIIVISMLVPMIITMCFPDYESVVSYYQNDYYMEDIDHDGEEECLILEGERYWHGNFNVYDKVEDNVVKIGELTAGSMLYKNDSGNYYDVMTHTGYTVVNQISKTGKLLLRRKVFEEDTDTDQRWSYERAIEKFNLQECNIIESNDNVGEYLQ